MSFQGSDMASTMQQVLMGMAMSGSDVAKLCKAVGKGCELGVKKATYKSIFLAGTGPGTGATETGVGVIIPPGLIATFILAEAVPALAGGGVGLPLIAQAAEAAFILTAMKISLSGSLPGATAGASTLPPAISITAVAADWADAVDQAGIPESMLGTDWHKLAKAIGKGCAQGLAMGTVPALVVAGAPSGVQGPVTGLPGSGTLA